jgi:choline dehydrogenase
MLMRSSAIINAAATLLPSESDWDVFDKGVGDGLWRSVILHQIEMWSVLC